MKRSWFYTAFIRIPTQLGESEGMMAKLSFIAMLMLLLQGCSEHDQRNVIQKQSLTPSEIQDSAANHSTGESTAGDQKESRSEVKMTPPLLNLSDQTGIETAGRSPDTEKAGQAPGETGVRDQKSVSQQEGRLNLFSNLPGFVGSLACAECHRERFESYLKSDHSRSLREPDSDEEIRDRRVEHPLSGRAYTIDTAANGDLLHSEHILDASGTGMMVQQKRIDLVMGSGAFAKSYMSCDADGCVQSPITYFVGSKDYEMSPGYDRVEHYGFSRQINDQCLFCHAGLLSRKNGNVNQFEIHEKAIGCERCHGAGEAHSDSYRKLSVATSGKEMNADIAGSIINPAKLSRSQVQSLCAQCHLQGNVTLYEPGADAWSFRPGEELETTKAEYSVGVAGEEIGFVGHFAQLEQSKCFQNSEMTCVSCHDPHHVGSEVDHVELQRTQCYACHKDQACKIPQLTRIQNNENHCVACHMPKRKSEVPHVAITNHRIGIHVDGPKDLQTDGPELNGDDESSLPSPVALLDAAPKDSPKRRLHEAMALGRWMLVEAMPEQATLASFQATEKQLASAMAEQPTERLDALLLHANLRFAIASRFDNNMDEQTALSTWKSLTTDASRCEKAESLSLMDRCSATMILANAAFEFEQFDKSLVRFQRLTQVRRDASDWYNLGLCFAKLKRFADADASFRKAISLNVTYAAPYLALSRMYESIDPVQSRTIEQQARIILDSPDGDRTANTISE